MNAPGAMTGAPLAALTIPPAPMIGVDVLASTEPGVVPDPTRPASDTACKVITTFAPARRGVHVAAHCPLPSEFRFTEDSPVENVALTDPLSTLFPQLSMISASSGAGCPTVPWNQTGTDVSAVTRP